MTTLSETAALPVILPLSEAARKTGTDESTLRAMVQSGKIRAFIDPQGIMYVQMTPNRTLPVAVADAQQHLPNDDINARLRQIRREDFAHLEGVAITLTEAAKKYNIPRPTLVSWVKRYAPFVRVLKPGYRAEYNEADIAYLVHIYRTRREQGILSGVPLVDNKGKPKLIKHPSLSRAKREA